ncbi:hypothetical protein NDN08_002860 [Rhodosorus marinus]|uniref:Diphthamide biosynthesis protein 3 n=1 Tax=Rhodosorus marinus TaxID=101924 RepID=A0AAV8UZ71_9RHOD|nr:hypothetical protein NDN08_002860 [Rhodosorus marinus]
MSFYDEIEIEDMERLDDEGMYTYPCPCGDVFQISFEDLLEGEEVARCPSCSLIIRVIYDEGFMDSSTQVFEAAKVAA